MYVRMHICTYVCITICYNGNRSSTDNKEHHRKINYDYLKLNVCMYVYTYMYVIILINFVKFNFYWHIY